MNFAELDVSLGKASRHQVESFVKDSRHLETQTLKRNSGHPFLEKYSNGIRWIFHDQKFHEIQYVAIKTKSMACH